MKEEEEEEEEGKSRRREKSLAPEQFDFCRHCRGPNNMKISIFICKLLDRYLTKYTGLLARRSPDIVQSFKRAINSW